MTETQTQSQPDAAEGTAAQNASSSNGVPPAISPAGDISITYHETGPAVKRPRLDNQDVEEIKTQRQWPKGTAPVKAEYLLDLAQSTAPASRDDDASENAGRSHDQPNGKSGRREKQRGQNKARQFGHSREGKTLCISRACCDEFSPRECPYKDHCRFEHDLRRYLADEKSPDLTTLDGQCPVLKATGSCPRGWKCRFAGSHSQERLLEDGRRELCLTCPTSMDGDDDVNGDLVNVVSSADKLDLAKRKITTEKADAYSKWMDAISASTQTDAAKRSQGSNLNSTLQNKPSQDVDKSGQAIDKSDADARHDVKESDSSTRQQDLRAQYREPPFLPSEKRRLYFGPETPSLAPLTTQGNLPFRRLCIDMGAQLTYSEMAMSQPLVQGQKSEWALLRAHRIETQPPAFSASSSSAPSGYDHSRDSRFGAQIAGNKPWMTLKATEVLTRLCPHLRVVDLNCGCPIDLVYRQGAGSALMDAPAKLEKILRGMNAVSSDVPVTVKIRTGTRDNHPTASRLVDRLVYGTQSAMSEATGQPSGVAAITLHGRSRQQRYTRSANWEYIAECAALVQRHRTRGDDLADTAGETDARDGPASERVFFIGNGDCYSHEDYTRHLDQAQVDAVMVGRGALVKPWLFEEIATGQYLDKSATERLGYIERYVRYGLETWGSDELGVSLTRRFLLEWLSFAYRYIPIGILEYLPPSLQDRPPAWRGRNELESLLASDNFRDWIKISDMFLGPAKDDFKFVPKHKSNSYEIQAEG